MDVPSTGNLQQSDTITVAIPIPLLKSANAKLIERNYLLSITAEQDSIIKLKDLYILEQQGVIDDFQNRLTTANKINESVNNELKKQKNKTKLLGCGASVAVISLIIGLVVK